LTFDDSACPGRCVPLGEAEECTCPRVAPTCEEAQELPPGTINEITHGGWFTFIAEAPATAIETCGSTGFNADFSIWEGECQDPALGARSTHCSSESASGSTTPDPLASCYGSGRFTEACTCIDTEIGRRYRVEVDRARLPGVVTNITRSNRLTCEAIWDGGACCDRDTGDCADDVAEFDCPGRDHDWFPQRACESVYCATYAIPALSDWGLVILTLLGLTIGSVAFRRRGIEVERGRAAGAP